MRPFALSLVSAASIMFTVTAVHAQDRPTTLIVSTSIAFSISPKGEATTPSAAESFAIGIPVGEDVTLVPELGMVTSFTTFQPNPQLQFGASFRLAERFALGVSVAYRYMPYWANVASDSHVAVSTIAPVVVLPSSLLLIFPVGICYNSSTQQVTIPLAVKFAVPIPF